MISREKIAEVSSSMDAVRIAESLGLKFIKKTGHDHWSLCPFHAERKPSFKVDDSRKNFKCFGCDASGTIFDLILKIRGGKFPDAVRFAADSCGVSIDEDGDRPRAHVAVAGDGFVDPGIDDLDGVTPPSKVSRAMPSTVDGGEDFAPPLPMECGELFPRPSSKPAAPNPKFSPEARRVANAFAASPVVRDAPRMPRFQSEPAGMPPSAPQASPKAAVVSDAAEVQRAEPYLGDVELSSAAEVSYHLQRRVQPLMRLRPQTAEAFVRAMDANSEDLRRGTDILDDMKASGCGFPLYFASRDRMGVVMMDLATGADVVVMHKRGGPWLVSQTLPVTR